MVYVVRNEGSKFEREGLLRVGVNVSVEFRIEEVLLKRLVCFKVVMERGVLTL